jgi:hypothetical protein
LKVNIHTISEHNPVKPALAPAVRTAATNGGWIDTNGYDRALIELHVGAHDRTTGDEVLDVKIQESSDAGVGDAAADIAGAAFPQVAGQAIDATKGNVYLIDMKLDKRERYIRPVGTPAGTTPSTAYGVTVTLYRGGKAPVSQDATVVKV